MANTGTFVTCRKTVKITDDLTGEVFRMPSGFIGSVPKWVENHWYYKAMCNSGTITAIVSTHDNDLEKTEAEAKSKETAKRIEQEKAAKINTAKANAKKEAAEEATEKGLTKIAAKDLEKKKVAEAIAEVESEYKD